MYLDRNKTAPAKDILDEMLASAKTAGNMLYQMKINTVLGEIYFRESNHIMAEKHLLAASNTQENEYDDALDYEKEKCKELLAEINKLKIS
jgi:hypothetical protein